MIRKNDRQSSFMDADYICDRLVPQDDFYRKFKELVTPLIKDEDFEDMYCIDNGRPATPPSLMACASILQHYRGLSDREMEDACTWDIRVKHALGLGIDEKPFDHSSLGNFRQRLLENGREKDVFERILKHLIEKKLIKKNEIQRIDATHVIADIAVPSTIKRIKRGIFDVLELLKENREDLWNEIAKEIDIEEYHQSVINKDVALKPKDERRKKILVKVVVEARIVLHYVENLDFGEDFRNSVDMLKDLLQENINTDDKGKIYEMDIKQKPRNLTVSPIDPDARYGTKSITNHFIGYKANVTETVKSRFITNIVATRGNVYDGDPMVQLIAEQKKFGMSPEKLIGDTAYGSGSNRKNVGDYGIKVVAPIYGTYGRLKDIFPKSRFKYDEKNKCVTCPKGVKNHRSYFDTKTCRTTYFFPFQECNVCDWQERCTNSEDERRTMAVTPWHKEQMAAEKYNKTEQYRKEMKLRQAIEGTHSEMKRYHGLTRTRYRGLPKVGLQCYFTAAAVNIKRWVKVMLQRLKPKRVAWVT